MKRKFLLVLFATVLIVNAIAQPVIRGQKELGGSKDDYFSSMYLTNDGGLIAGGFAYSDSSGTKTANSRGLVDYWVIKMDAENKIQWDKTIGGSDWDELHAIQQTTDGGYILGGYSASNISGEKTENSRGYSDYWVVKLDNAGNIQWNKTIGGIDGDDLRSLQQTGDGGYILGGSSKSNISGEKTENSRGELDYWIVKLDNIGNIQWNKTIGGAAWDDLASLQQTKDGGYILGGTSQSNASGEKTQNSKGYADFWVVKLDIKGNIQWDKTLGGNSDDVLVSLQQTTDNGYFLAGWSRSGKSGDKTGPIKGGDDYWVVKIDSLGNVQGDKTIGGTNTDYLTVARQTKDGGYILGGYSTSDSSADKSENNRSNTGGWDYWIVKLNKNLNKRWDKTIGGKDEDICYDVREVSANHYIIGGISNSRRSADKTVGSQGVYDYWLVKLVYNNPGSFEITDVQNKNYIVRGINNNAFSAYPNPAKDILHIQATGNNNYMLINQQGKVMIIKSINSNGDIDVSHLPAGMYFLKNTRTGTVEKINKIN